LIYKKWCCLYSNIYCDRCEQVGARWFDYHHISSFRPQHTHIHTFCRRYRRHACING